MEIPLASSQVGCHLHGVLLRCWTHTRKYSITGSTVQTQLTAIEVVRNLHKVRFTLATSEPGRLVHVIFFQLQCAQNMQSDSKPLNLTKYHQSCQCGMREQCAKLTVCSFKKQLFVFRLTHGDIRTGIKISLQQNSRFLRQVVMA